MLASAELQKVLRDVGVPHVLGQVLGEDVVRQDGKLGWFELVLFDEGLFL